MSQPFRGLLFVCAISAGVLFSGCAQRIGAFTIASTKNVKVNAIEKGGRVEGRHTTFFGQASLEEAVDRAIAKSPGADALIDVVVYFMPIGSLILNTGYKVVGTPVSTKEYSMTVDGKPLISAGSDVEDIKKIARFIAVDQIR